MRGPVGAIAAAVQFLTRVPIPRRLSGAATLPEAAPYFPAVGGLLGLAAGTINISLRTHLAYAAAAGVTVLLLVLATGALHEDGLADCADAFGGGERSRERILAIMRDSRIGGFGAVAVGLSLLLRTALIASLRPGHAVVGIVCAETLSRWSVLPVGAVLPAARQDSGTAGLGASLARRLSPSSLALGTLLAIAVTLGAVGRGAWQPWAVCVALTAASAWYFQRRIGGVTGDCFGALTQIVAVGVYACEAWR